MKTGFMLGALSMGMSSLLSQAPCNAPTSPPGPTPATFTWSILDMTTSVAITPTGSSTSLPSGNDKYLVTVHSNAPDGITTTRISGVMNYNCQGVVSGGQ